jgi:hypothetical protein
MSDADAKPGPTAEPSDPFAGARATFRDTLKWLTTTFAGVIGVVIAGTSLTGISKVPAHDQLIALLGCSVGLLCIVAATGVMLQLLLPQTFYFGELLEPKNQDLLRRLDAHAVEFLPPEFAHIGDFMRERDSAVLKMRVNRSDPESPAYIEGATFLDDNFDAIARLAYLAHYELLRRNLRRRQWLLFLLAVLAIGGLGLFAVKVGSVKDHSSAKPPPPIEAHVSLDVSSALLLLHQASATDVVVREVLETVVDSSVIKEGGTPTSKSLLAPLLAVIQSLQDAGALSKEIGTKLREELIKNAVEGGKEILVETAKKIIEHFFPAPQQGVVAPVTVNVAGCCNGCATNPTKKPKDPPGAVAPPKTCPWTTGTAP